MTENDAPESTRARIGFLSIITSSWLPVILAVDGGFPVHAASPPGRSLSLAFSPYGLHRLDRRDMATGSVTTYWDRPRGIPMQNGEKSLVGVFFSANVVEVPSAVSRVVKDSLSLGSSALHVQTSAVETNRSVVSRSPHICFSGSGGNFKQELCISWLQRRMLVVVLVSVGFVDTGAKTRQLRLERSLLRIGDRSPKILASG
ncbi:hypothetical protein TNCV_1372451 [Trichonephila clavipes]|nr:hypothetical protein TNCV_1372451 [Trichonephila clavipes]